MVILRGISASRGYASGMAAVKVGAAAFTSKWDVEDTDTEIARFRSAQDIYDAKLEELRVETEKTLGAKAAEIFSAYRLIVRDEVFFKTALCRVEKEKVNVEYAVRYECSKVAALLNSMADAYMKERAADIENVCNELIRIMTGSRADPVPKPDGENDVILISEDLTPAETIKLDKDIVRGLVMEKGGVTSHTVILAKALGIPVIVGVRGARDAVCDGDFVQLDAFKGEIAVNPDAESKKAFSDLNERHETRRRMLAVAERGRAVTRDGFTVDVRVNAGAPVSVEGFDAERCDGIGLFRTEFIHMHASDYPNEEYQFKIYKEIAERACGKEVVIRTLDIGGDKRPPYMDLPAEENPFLGCRGIRLCLKRTDIFKTQIRAILRASAFGNIKIMFPMIVNMEELLESKRIVDGEKAVLRELKIPFCGDIPVGIMVETPAAVMLSDCLAREADFISVGSNDLIQYITAADRSNARVRELYDSCNISVLRSINIVAGNAAAAGIPWGICGEAASEDRLIPLWVAMGVNGLSVAPFLVGAVKHLINCVNRTEMLAELDKVLAFSSTDEVKAYLDGILSRLDY